MHPGVSVGLAYSAKAASHPSGGGVDEGTGDGEGEGDTDGSAGSESTHDVEDAEDDPEPASDEADPADVLTVAGHERLEQTGPDRSAVFPQVAAQALRSVQPGQREVDQSGPTTTRRGRAEGQHVPTTQQARPAHQTPGRTGFMRPSV